MNPSPGRTAWVELLEMNLTMMANHSKKKGQQR